MKNIIKVIIIVLFIILVSVLCVIMIKKEEPKEIVDEKYYVKDNAIYEKNEEINIVAIENNLNKINNLCKKYLENNKKYFSIIPDKEYYLKANVSNVVETDFGNLENAVTSKLAEKIQYFSIVDTLTLDDFYKTDMHWRQENLEKTVEKIENELGINSKKVDYEEQTLGEFYGTYYNNTSKIENIKLADVKPDEMIYLTNKELENCKVYNTETQKNEKIYNKDRVNETKNKYDLFLSGATALTTITNENAQTDKKLILFRDSFGSSIAPLLAKDYKEIVLVDIRYINSTILENYLDFDKYENADVLFLYSSRVINKSGIFR